MSILATWFRSPTHQIMMQKFWTLHHLVMHRVSNTCQNTEAIHLMGRVWNPMHHWVTQNFLYHIWWAKFETQFFPANVLVILRRNTVRRFHKFDGQAFRTRTRIRTLYVRTGWLAPPTRIPCLVYSLAYQLLLSVYNVCGVPDQVIRRDVLVCSHCKDLWAHWVLGRTVALLRPDFSGGERDQVQPCPPVQGAET